MTTLREAILVPRPCRGTPIGTSGLLARTGQGLLNLQTGIPSVKRLVMVARTTFSRLSPLFRRLRTKLLIELKMLRMFPMTLIIGASSVTRRLPVKFGRLFGSRLLTVRLIRALNRPLMAVGTLTGLMSMNLGLTKTPYTPGPLVNLVLRLAYAGRCLGPMIQCVPSWVCILETLSISLSRPSGT